MCIILHASLKHAWTLVLQGCLCVHLQGACSVMFSVYGWIMRGLSPCRGVFVQTLRLLKVWIMQGRLRCRGVCVQTLGWLFTGYLCCVVCVLGLPGGCRLDKKFVAGCIRGGSLKSMLLSLCIYLWTLGWHCDCFKGTSPAGIDLLCVCLMACSLSSACSTH